MCEPEKRREPPAEPAGEAEERERFVRDLLTRGEAARPDERGELPPGATHEIVEDAEGGGVPTVRRRRFSAS
jgi:hypothetical protein